MTANTPAEVRRLLQSTIAPPWRATATCAAPATESRALRVEIGPAGGAFVCPSESYGGVVLYAGHVCGAWCGHEREGGAEHCECAHWQKRRPWGGCKHIRAARAAWEAREEQAAYTRAAPARAVQQRVVAEFDAAARQYPTAREAVVRQMAQYPEESVWGPGHD